MHPNVPVACWILSTATVDPRHAASPAEKQPTWSTHTGHGFYHRQRCQPKAHPRLRSVIAIAPSTGRNPFSGESLGRWFPETFDSILLDAPCSMENLRPTPSHPLRETTDSERLRLQEMQIRLLISGLSALKIGGQLVYATCSLAPEENEAVIDQVLKLYPDALIIEDLSSSVLSMPRLSICRPDFPSHCKHSATLPI